VPLCQSNALPTQERDQIQITRRMAWLKTYAQFPQPGILSLSKDDGCQRNAAPFDELRVLSWVFG
jgi:hypothetical protein